FCKKLKINYMQTKPKNLIIELTLQFALDSIEYVETLEEKRKFVVANQLLKSATSIGAISREAQNAESKSDFINKMKIAHKEGDETEYWLEICQKAKSYPNPPDELIESIKSIQRVLSKIIGTSKKPNNVSK
ncbi:MAG: four helix bundle protein, partial [Bacteroidia bacterium]